LAELKRSGQFWHKLEKLKEKLGILAKVEEKWINRQ
jgi:hypothetical protein